MLFISLIASVILHTVDHLILSCFVQLMMCCLLSLILGYLFSSLIFILNDVAAIGFAIGGNSTFRNADRNVSI